MKFELLVLFLYTGVLLYVPWSFQLHTQEVITFTGATNHYKGTTVAVWTAAKNTAGFLLNIVKHHPSLQEQLFCGGERHDFFLIYLKLTLSIFSNSAHKHRLGGTSRNSSSGVSGWVQLLSHLLLEGIFISLPLHISQFKSQ